MRKGESLNLETIIIPELYRSKAIMLINIKIVYSPFSDKSCQVVSVDCFQVLRIAPHATFATLQHFTAGAVGSVGVECVPLCPAVSHCVPQHSDTDGLTMQDPWFVKSAPLKC